MEERSQKMISFQAECGGIRLVCALHSTDAPTDAEWNQYLGRVAALKSCGARGDGCGGLAISDGGGPNARQRLQLVQAVGGHRPVGAVVTNSLAVRGIVTALIWYGIRTLAFRPAELGAALDHLRIPRRLQPALCVDIEARLADITVHSYVRPAFVRPRSMVPIRTAAHPAVCLDSKSAL